MAILVLAENGKEPQTCFYSTTVIGPTPTKLFIIVAVCIVAKTESEKHVPKYGQPFWYPGFNFIFFTYFYVGGSYIFRNNSKHILKITLQSSSCTYHANCHLGNPWVAAAKAYVFGVKAPIPAISRWTTCGSCCKYYLYLGSLYQVVVCPWLASSSSCSHELELMT